jgi:DNA-binding winged helix-turn-helix (wHTH) protein
MGLVFGECELDPGRRLLLRHGLSVPLSPKAFQLLELLLDRRPEAVTKTHILERLWPETFVSDGSLHSLVAELRAALGDSPRVTRYIRTVPRFGYAFCGEVRPAPATRVSKPAQSGACIVLGPQEWPLSEGPNLVGRDRDCAIRVDSGTVSRHHLRIVVTRDLATVEDLESRNGTRVNGQRVGQRLTLKDGDEIRMGSVTMTYRVLDGLPSTFAETGVSDPQKG